MGEPTEDSATRDLASWVAGELGEIESSEVALGHAETSFVDTAACMLVGTTEHGPRRVAGLVQTGADLAASVVGMGTTASAADAALVNAMSAHLLDYDDGDSLTMSHQSCVLVPALLAVAEERHMSAVEMLDAYLIGYHVNQALGVMRQGTSGRGFHNTSASGVLGATAAVARLRGLTATQTAVALGIAAHTSAGIRANFGTDMKAFGAGRAASNAIMATSFAAAGVTASTA